MLEVCARVPAKVPAKPRAGCAGQIGRTGIRKSACEGNMWLCAFGPHAVVLGEMRVPFHALQVRVHAW